MSKPKVNTRPVIPVEGLVRLSQVLGCRRHGIVPTLPISRNGICASMALEAVRAMLVGMKAVGQ